MLVSVSDAKGQLTELVRRAEAGDEVVLTRHGKAVARLVAQQAFQAAIQGAARATGGAFFDLAIHELARTLGVRTAFVAERVGTGRPRVLAP